MLTTYRQQWVLVIFFPQSQHILGENSWQQLRVCLLTIVYGVGICTFKVLNWLSILHLNLMIKENNSHTKFFFGEVSCHCLGNVAFNIRKGCDVKLGRRRQRIDIISFNWINDALFIKNPVECRQGLFISQIWRLCASSCYAKSVVKLNPFLITGYVIGINSGLCLIFLWVNIETEYWEVIAELNYVDYLLMV